MLKHIPVRPNLNYLKNYAKDLLRLYRANDPLAIALFNEFHHQVPQFDESQLSDAQLVLARSLGITSWHRLSLACKLIEAIWNDDPETVRKLILKHPKLLTENARGIEKCNWGPPMSYAANLDRERIVRMLHEMGAQDHFYAIGRATLQGQISTARFLVSVKDKIEIPAGSLGGPAYTLSVTGTQLMLELGAPVVDEDGQRLAPVDVVLETDSRKPREKHQILELYVQYGLELPDTPVMALHRGRIDLLAAHLKRDPQLLKRTFTHEEIYPPELGCHDEVLATHGTPLNGATLLHMCVDYDEIDIALWLVEQSMDVNLPAEIDTDGFGGHTALFSSVVSQPNFWMNYQKRQQMAPFTELLLRHGAEVNKRVSLRKRLHPGYNDDALYEYRDVTPISWGRRFHQQVFVSQPAICLIEEHHGIE